MRVANRSAFTIAEAVVAVLVLSIGLLALVGSVAMTSRMLGSGRQSTRAGRITAARVERLRQVAFSTAPACTDAEWRSDSAVSLGITESWRILDQVGAARRVLVVVRSRQAPGSSSDTVVTGMLCGPP